MARLTQIVIDCTHPAALARFWESALDEFEVRSYDDAEISRLAQLGFTPETDPTVLVDGPHMELCFRRADDAAPIDTPRSVHFDITSADRHREIVRLETLGATVVEHFSQHSWMRDPDGNDFCIIDVAPAHPAPAPTSPRAAPRSQ
jgi:hypothetical protein